MADVIISGYHGFKNSGDEALLYAIVTTLRKEKEDIDITVLSKVPEETKKEYGVNSINRYSLPKIIREMKKSKMLLFGGGSLLQDATSRKSIKYYLGIIALAKMCGLKTMLYANGIGPIDGKVNRFLTKRILKRVDLITLRDDKSDEFLKKLGVKGPEIKITADPAFTIDTKGTLSGKYFLNRLGVPEDTRLAVISIRNWKNLKSNFSDELARLLDYMVTEFNIYPIFVPLQYPQDEEASLLCLDKMKEKGYVINRELTVPEMFSVIKEADLLIGMRLHSLIYATTLSVPAMALSYDPKVTAFMASLSQPDTIDAENLSFETAKEELKSIVRNIEKLKENLKSANCVLKEKAEENAKMAVELLRSGL